MLIASDIRWGSFELMGGFFSGLTLLIRFFAFFRRNPTQRSWYVVVPFPPPTDCRRTAGGSARVRPNTGLSESPVATVCAHNRLRCALVPGVIDLARNGRMAAFWDGCAGRVHWVLLLQEPLSTRRLASWWSPCTPHPTTTLVDQEGQRQIGHVPSLGGGRQMEILHRSNFSRDHRSTMGRNQCRLDGGTRWSGFVE